MALWENERLHCFLCGTEEVGLLPELDVKGWSWFTGLQPKRQEICPKCVKERRAEYAAALTASTLPPAQPAPSVQGEELKPCPVPFALLVLPEWAPGRGLFAAPGHMGYVNDWRRAGRFSREVAETYAELSPGKYMAIPLPEID